MSEEEPSLGELRRRLERAERDLAAIRDNYPTEKLVEERLRVVGEQITAIRSDMDAVEHRLDAVRDEALQRRLLIYGAVVMAVTSLIVALLLGGGFQVGA